MMKAGQNHMLTVARISDYGLYLADEAGDEVLLPNRYVSLDDKIGDKIDVFVYHDSEDRLVATRETPLVHAGEVAYLKVVDKNLHGAFLDWGLSGKDLFLPNRNQQGGILAGRSYVIYAYVDDITGRCVATNQLKSFINNETLHVVQRQEVELLVASESEIGYRVVVDNRHWGMLYRNQLFQPVAIGDRLRGYVSKITDDHRIDVTLRQPGYAGVRDNAEELLAMLREAGGRLPLNDNSSPEEIHRRTKLSKKAFKRSLGVLLKRGTVKSDDKGIILVEETRPKKAQKHDRK